MSDKRSDYISWDGYFMGVAFLSALRSKDPSTRNGSCIVDEKNRIVGTGYNGFPRNCDDDAYPWAREGATEMDKKYLWVIHSECNAIHNSVSRDLDDCRLYLYSEKGYLPCNECAKHIIQSGIKKIVVAWNGSGKNAGIFNWDATKRMFLSAHVDVYAMDFGIVERDFGIIDREIHLIESRKRDS